MPAVSRANVQGLIFHPYPCPHARIFLLAFGETTAASRGFLAAWLGRITTAAQDPFVTPDPLANLSITWAGLRALGAVDAEAATRFPDEFVTGPEADILGDYGESAPEGWWNRRFRTGDIHLALHLHARSADALESATGDLRRDTAAAGMRELLPLEGGEGALTGRWLSDDGRELHFGYRDGFSQPAINWDDTPERGNLLDFRHVLLGHASDDVPSSPRRAPWTDIARDGTYVVARWLSQDVAGFERYLTENAALTAPDQLSLPEARELLAAKIMGRWRDGTPLVLSPDKPAPELATKDFDYGNDQDGMRCPLTAHIRIANRRDDSLSASNKPMFGIGLPRIVRRGMSYGPKYIGEGAEDGIDRGIIGTFLCASINRQFYPLTRWMHTTNFREVFRGDASARQDPLVGNRRKPGADNSFVVPTPHGEVMLRGLPDFVRTRGTAFLLMPGMSGLARLADGDAAE